MWVWDFPSAWLGNCCLLLLLWPYVCVLLILCLLLARRATWQHAERQQWLPEGLRVTDEAFSLEPSISQMGLSMSQQRDGTSRVLEISSLAETGDAGSLNSSQHLCQWEKNLFCRRMFLLQLLWGLTCLPFPWLQCFTSSVVLVYKVNGSLEGCSESTSWQGLMLQSWMLLFRCLRLSEGRGGKEEVKTLHSRRGAITSATIEEAGIRPCRVPMGSSALLFWSKGFFKVFIKTT